MNSSKNKSQVKTRWAQFELQLNFLDDILYLHIKNTLNNRKFKALYSKLPSSLKLCHYGSLEEFYIDISGIVKSQQKLQLQRFKIQENGNIKIFRRLSTFGEEGSKIGVLKTQEYFDQSKEFDKKYLQKLIFDQSRAHQAQQKQQALQIMSKISQNSNRINSLSSQFNEIKQIIQNFVKNTNLEISSLGQHALRRGKFFQQDSKILKKLQNVFIQGFFCDFYLRKDCLQMFLINAQNGDQFFILVPVQVFQQNNQKMIQMQVQINQSPQAIYSQIESIVTNSNINNKMKISETGILTLQREIFEMNESFEINEIYIKKMKIQQFKGQKMECNPIQVLKKKLWLQKLRNQNFIERQTDLMRLQLKSRIKSIKSGF